MVSPRRRVERSALKYLNSVYVATIFTNLKKVLFDFASRGAISCDYTARDRHKCLASLRFDIDSGNLSSVVTTLQVSP